MWPSGRRPRPVAPEAAADRLSRLVRGQRLTVLDPDDLDAYPVSPGYAPGEHHFPDTRGTHTPSRALVHEARWPGPSALSAEQEEGRRLARAAGTPVSTRPRQARPLVTIEALRTLRAYGRPVG